jgi:hypothetical protein
MVAKRTKAIFKDALVAILLAIVILALVAHRLFHPR